MFLWPDDQNPLKIEKDSYLSCFIEERAFFLNDMNLGQLKRGVRQIFFTKTLFTLQNAQPNETLETFDIIFTTLKPKYIFVFEVALSLIIDDKAMFIEYVLRWFSRGYKQLHW